MISTRSRIIKSLANDKEVCEDWDLECITNKFIETQVIIKLKLQIEEIIKFWWDMNTVVDNMNECQRIDY